MSHVAKTVVRYARENNAAVILVEHDVSRARELADRLVVMDDGRLNPFISSTKTLEVKMNSKVRILLDIFLRAPILSLVVMDRSVDD